MPKQPLVKEGFTFVFEEVKGITRVRSVSGRMISKSTTVEKAKIPEPLSGPIGKGTDLYGLGVDRGHIVAQSVGGPNISENIVAMYSYFNRIGPWRAAELAMNEALSSSPHVAIEITYDPSKPALPTKFMYNVSKVPITSASGGIEVAMQLKPAEPYNPKIHELDKADSVLAIKQFEDFVVPVLTKDRDRLNPYMILQEVNDERGVFRIQQFGKFTKGQRIWIKMLNSHYSDNGFLTSDVPEDPYKVLNCFGGWDYPQVDHDTPWSVGGTNDFTNARLVSYKYNSDKRASMPDDQKAAVLAQAAAENDGRLRERPAKRLKT
jgi:hypothetical protein